jgi:hypothetical protein
MRTFYETSFFFMAFISLRMFGAIGTLWRIESCRKNLPGAIDGDFVGYGLFYMGRFDGAIVRWYLSPVLFPVAKVVWILQLGDSFGNRSCYSRKSFRPLSFQRYCITAPGRRVLGRVVYA